MLRTALHYLNRLLLLSQLLVALLSSLMQWKTVECKHTLSLATSLLQADAKAKAHLGLSLLCCQLLLDIVHLILHVSNQSVSS